MRSASLKTLGLASAICGVSLAGMQGLQVVSEMLVGEGFALGLWLSEIVMDGSYRFAERTLSILFYGTSGIFLYNLAKRLKP